MDSGCPCSSIMPRARAGVFGGVMLVPYSSLMRSSRYQTMYSSSRRMNSSMVTPVKSRSWKNSCLSRPKNPSAAALSGLQPFALMERVSPCSSQMPIHPGHRFSGSLDGAVDDRTLAVPERGARLAQHPVGQLGVRPGADIVQATGIPSWQSITGDRYALARSDAELGDVRDREAPVRRLGVEVPVHEVRGRLAADLAPVRAVAARPFERGDEPVPGSSAA